MAGFLALGRTRYDEPLSQVGRIEADPSDAPSAAQDQFGDGLIELSLLPESEVVWVLRDETADE